MSKLQDLLRNVPEYWNTDPEPVAVLVLTYDGTACYAIVEDDTLELVPTGGSGTRQSFQLDLTVTDVLTGQGRLLMLSDLVTAINLCAGYHATVVETNWNRFYDGTGAPPRYDSIWRTRPQIYNNQPLPGGITQAAADGGHHFTTTGWYTNEPAGARPLMEPATGTGVAGLGACVLLDCVQDLVQNAYLGAATNLLWPLFKTIARTLRDAESYGDDLVRQMDQRAALGPWLDRWGALYGTPRLPSEPDNDYRQRISTTAFRPRNNGQSIRKALTEGLGMSSVTLVDDPGQAFAFDVSVLAPPSRAYNLGANVNATINLYRAAGTVAIQATSTSQSDSPAAIPFGSIRLDRAFDDSTSDAWAGSDSVILHLVDSRSPTPGVGSSGAIGAHMLGGSMFGG